MLPGSLPTSRLSNPSGGLTAQLVRLDDLTADQRDQWAGLFQEQTGPGNPFCSPIWVGCWYRQYVPSADRRLVWASEGGRLVGVAPLYVQHLQLAGLPLADRLTMVGAGRTTPFELPQVLSAPGHGRAVSRAVVNRTLDQRVAWTELSLTRDQGWFTPGISGGWQGHRIGFQRHQESRACRPRSRWSCLGLPPVHPAAGAGGAVKLPANNLSRDCNSGFF